MTILYTNGCSWTVGSELEFDEELYKPWAALQPSDKKPEDYNITEFYNMYNWSAYLSKKLQADRVINDAIGGGSNQRMVRTTLEFIQTLNRKELDDLVVVLGWTSAERHEIYVDDKNIRGWHRINLTQPFGDFLYPWEREAAKDTVKAVEEYQKHYIASGSSLIGSLDLYFHQQFLMKNTLENLGIKYVFFQSVPAWWDAWMKDLDVDVYSSFETKLKSTEHKNNIGVYCEDAMQTVCHSKGFKHAPHRHVLSDGHKYWAEEVLFPRIVELYAE
jgi:hypothetical protein